MAISLIPYKKDKHSIRAIAGDFKLYVKEFAPPTIILITILVGYFVASSWFSVVRTEYEELQTEKASLQTIIKGSQTRELKSFVLAAASLDEVINKHVVLSNLFLPLEDSMHSNTTLVGLELDTSKGTMEIKAISTTFEEMGEQFLSWKEDLSFVSSISLDNFLKNSDGLIDFNVTIIILDGYLIK